MKKEIPEITEAKIRRWLGTTYAARGKAYFRQGNVLTQVVEGARISARVAGNTAQPYRVRIEFNARGGMHGVCSCPVAVDCKHVAATLYACMAEQQAQEDETSAVPQAFAQWLGSLDRAAQGKRVALDYPERVKQRLLYILEPDTRRGIRLLFRTARLRKDGSYGSASAYQPANILNYNIPAYMLAVDEKIVREVALDRSLNSLHGFRLTGEEGASLLRRILETGRCHWKNEAAPALKQGAKRKGAWHWQVDDEGVQHLALQVEHAAEVALTAPPWYLDTVLGECGPIESGQPADVAELLLNMPAIEADCPERVLQTIIERLPAGIPAPMALVQEVRQVMPVPVLRLDGIAFDRPGLRRPASLHVAELMFDYDGHLVPWRGRHGDSVRTVVGNRLISFRRHESVEAQALAEVKSAGLHPVQEFPYSDRLPKHLFTLADEHWWPEWMLHEVPQLQAQGIRIEIADAFAFRVERAASWQLNIEQAAGGGGLMGQSSFVGTLADGEEVDLIDAIARWVGERPQMLQEDALNELKQTEKIALPISGGRLLEASGAMVANILYYMLDLFAGHRGEKGAQVSAPQLLALEEKLGALSGQMDTPLSISSGDWLKQMRQLTTLDAVPSTAPPAQLKATLRDYQRDGLSWLQMLCRLQLNGILADDMGLGKTVQALAHLLKEKECGRLEKPALVVAPTSLMRNWHREAERFTPDLSVLVLHGPERAAHFEHLAQYDLVLTTYPLLVRDFEVLREQPWHMLILDEAQYIKNPRAKVAQSVRRLDARHKLCMTGTPMENHLGELWAQFDFLMPGYLHDQRRFSSLFRKPVELQGDTTRQEALNLRIRPFLLRRTKADVVAELPPKTEMIRSIDLEKRQRELYESVRLAMQKKVRAAVASMGMAKSQIVVLDALLKLRQVCCDPRLIAGLAGKAPPSAKLEMLRDMLPEMVEEGRRILLFSQFTSMLRLIEDELNDLGIDYVKLTGQTRDRATPVERFQSGEVPVFLISLKAGGVGLNLTAADTVIHYDPWWNPAVENQATDRAYRIGQDKAVFVYKLITEGTVEEKILQMQARKRDLAENIHRHAAAQTPLWSEEDMNALFAPLE